MEGVLAPRGTVVHLQFEYPCEPPLLLVPLAPRRFNLQDGDRRLRHLRMQRIRLIQQLPRLRQMLLESLPAVLAHLVRVSAATRLPRQFALRLGIRHQSEPRIDRTCLNRTSDEIVDDAQVLRTIL